jgi:predicted AAA+ superfamily ATPase
MVLDSLRHFPVVGLIGARQVGKTTLARSIAEGAKRKTVFLDLERPTDLARLSAPEMYLERVSDNLVILDEVQRRPDLFPILRALVDAKSHPGQFLVLGSASPALIRQSSESLAGRIRYHELGPFHLGEVETAGIGMLDLWSRGGFPGSVLCASEEHSAEWRNAFIQTYLERDIPALGVRIPATTLRRFWQMVAHCHGQIWNSNKVAGSLGVSAPTVRNYLDLLQDTFMVRQLQPYHANVKKRLVKSSKVYLRDSGLLHSLLNIPTLEDLLGHPSAGLSWEGWVIEQILAQAPPNWRPWFYRTSGGAEIDLLLERPGQLAPIAIEIKIAPDPTPTKGFWAALADLQPARGLVVCPCTDRYPLGRNAWTLPVSEIGSLAKEK